MKNRFCISIRIALLLITAIVSMTASGESEVARFFGQYEGQATSDSDGEFTVRELRVAIAPHQKGFTVKWVFVSHKVGGVIKRKYYEIDFAPTRRPHIYQAGMRTNKFGRRVPLDPMQGDPYIWARIEASVLLVYALHVLEDGGYEIQTYERTLTAQGLDVEYSRRRDGKLLRSVSGRLKKISQG